MAEEDGRVIGGALAIEREGVWGLSLLVVRPDHQSSGVGRALLERAHEYADGGRAARSSSPRPTRARCAPTPAPASSCTRAWTPRAARRDGAAARRPRRRRRATSRSPRPSTAHVRGAAHGADIAASWRWASTLLVVPERGYAVLGADGDVRLLAAFDEDAARDLLRAALAAAPGGEAPRRVDHRRAAVGDRRSCLEAGLELRTDAGAVFVGGDVGPFTPYLPSGAFL